MLRYGLVALLLVTCVASAAPRIATDDRPRGRIVYANDDDFDWTATGLVPTFDLAPGLQVRVHVDPEAKFAVVVNCCFGRDELASNRTPGHDTVDVVALTRVLDAGGDVILLDDGDLLAPVLLELLARRTPKSACLELPATPVKWPDGRTRSLISNRTVEALATCIQATTRTIERDTGMPGRLLLVGAFPAAPRVAR